jgi:hypothetical protein
VSVAGIDERVYGMNLDNMRARALSELREYLALSVYLWICFGALLILKSAILEARGVTYLPYGLAAIKALVSAKFLMVALVAGARRNRAGERLIVAIGRKTVLMLLILLILTAIEEAVMAAIHGHSIQGAIAGMVGGTPQQLAAMMLVMALILLPYVAYRTLGDAMGEDRLHRLLFDRR